MQKVVLALKIDFDQQTACGAPVCWLKYTTLINKYKLEQEEFSKKLMAGQKRVVKNCSQQSLNNTDLEMTIKQGS